MNWWTTRTLRERRLILAMAALALIVLAWLAVVRPLSDALEAARTRHGAAVTALALARAQVDAIAATRRGAPAGLDAPLDTFLANAASNAGLPVARVERGGLGQATVVMPSVRPQAFFAWLAAIEARGVVVDRVSLAPAGPQALQAQVTVRAGQR